MSRLEDVTKLVASALCEAVDKDEQGDGLDISAGLYGEETTKFIREIAEQLVELECDKAESDTKLVRLLQSTKSLFDEDQAIMHQLEIEALEQKQLAAHYKAELDDMDWEEY